LGISKLITKFNLSISIPLAAISVATKTLTSLFLKDFNALWRCGCDLSP
jgi:hypothetical protein